MTFVTYHWQEAERKFVLNLLELYKNIRRAVNLHGDLSHDLAELTVGRFGGIDVRAFICHFFCVCVCVFFTFQSLSFEE